MNILISPKWYKTGTEPTKVHATAHTAKYFQQPFVSINISQPSERRSDGRGYQAYQAKLRIDMSAEDARKLAAELLRHAETIENEAVQT